MEPKFKIRDEVVAFEGTEHAIAGTVRVIRDVSLSLEGPPEIRYELIPAGRGVFREEDLTPYATSEY